MDLVLGLAVGVVAAAGVGVVAAAGWMLGAASPEAVGSVLGTNVTEVDGIRVSATVWAYDRHGQRPFTRFEVAVPGGWDLVEGPAAGEPTTGDGAFDSRVRLAGAGPEVRALLGAEARQALLTLAAAGSLEVSDGQLRWTRDGRWSRDDGMAECVGLLLTAVKPLWIAATFGSEALAEVAVRDLVPEVRRRAFRDLVESHPERADEVARSLRDDPHPPLRAAARIRLADGAELSAIVVDRTLPDDLREQAVDRLDPKAAERIVLALLEEGSGLAVRGLALAAQASPPVSSAVAELCRSGSLDVRAAAADTVGRLEIALAEPALVAMTDADEPARSAAVRALGRVGTAAALPALERWTGPRVQLGLRDLCREAATAIRGRSSSDA